MAASTDADETLPSPARLDAVGARGVSIQPVLAEQVPEGRKEDRNSDAVDEVVEVPRAAGRAGEIPEREASRCSEFVQSRRIRLVSLRRHQWS